MIESPFEIEPEFTAADFEKLGRLTIRWAHIDHVLGNCLKRLLRITDEDAIIIVFPMPEERRMSAINAVAQNRRLNKTAKAALEVLNWVLPGLRAIRNNVVHTVIYRDASGMHHFELRSKGRRFSKEQVFAAEELTNYAAHAVISFRLALGLRSGSDVRYALPDKPAVPESLRQWFAVPSPTRKDKRRSRRRSSRK